MQTVSNGLLYRVVVHVKFRNGDLYATATDPTVDRAAAVDMVTWLISEWSGRHNVASVVAFVQQTAADWTESL